jgi:mannitol/fructose-specific phosphotransferase system IIA component (Ntr-type)
MEPIDDQRGRHILLFSNVFFYGKNVAIPHIRGEMANRAT